MALEQYLPSWVLDYLSPIVLVVGGLMALVIVIAYLKDKESGWYKLCVGIGLVVGVLIVALAFLEGYKATTFTKVLIVAAAFTLIIRPIREVHVSVIVGLLVMVLVYVLLGSLDGTTLLNGQIDLSVVASGWPRIIIAFVAGAFVYGLLNFAEALVKLFGKILNFWPVLLVLGIICIAEGACIYLGYGSIFDFIRGIEWKTPGSIVIAALLG